MSFLEALKRQKRLFTGTGRNGQTLNLSLKMMGQILLFRSSTVKNVSFKHVLYWELKVVKFVSVLSAVKARLHVLDNIFSRVVL